MTKLNISLLLLLIPLFSWTQTNYYVSQNTGVDSNTGLTVSTAFKTPQKAVDVATFGDTVNILAGTYSNSTYGSVDIWKDERTIHIKDKLNNTNTKYLVIRPYQEDFVKLKGDGSFIIQIVNSSYIHIEGLELEGETENITLSFAEQHQFTYKDADENILQRVPPNSTDEEIENMTLPVLTNITRPTYFNTHGIGVNGSHHIKIIDNVVHHTPGEGIRSFTSDYLTINGNIVHNCSRKSSTGVHGLSVYTLDAIDEFTGYKVFVENNRVYDNYNELYSWSAQKTSIKPHIDEGKGITIQRCTAGRGWTHGRVLFRNNLTYHNGFSGLHVNNGERIDIINNTSYWNHFTGGGSQHGISAQSSIDIKIINNIIMTSSTSNGRSINVSGTGPFIIQNNLINNSMGSDADAIDEQTISADAFFTSPSNFDFSLQSTSQAIGGGLTNQAPLVDYYGNSRDAQPDIGAIEWQECLPTISFQNKTLATNIYKAEQTITTNQSTTIQPFSFTHFYAGNSITLKPGFSVGPNTFFHAKIQADCNETNFQEPARTRNKIDFNHQKKSATEVYPNPFKDHILLKNNELDYREINIFNVWGQDVTNQIRISEDRPIRVDSKDLPKGTYFLKTRKATFTIFKL